MWYDIPNYPDYKINKLGEVLSNKSNRILKGSIEKHGYTTVTLYFDKKGKTFTVHRIMADVFLKEKVVAGKTCVNHKNGIKSDNRLDNLEVVSYSDNTSHGYKHRLMPEKHGTNNGSAKITEKQAKEIMSRLREGQSGLSIAKDMSVSKHIIYDIKRGKTWRYLAEQEESDEGYARRTSGRRS